MFDTHCHLNLKAFENKINEVFEGARKAGVNRIIVPGTDLSTSKKAVEIAEKYEGVYAAVGIHPHHIAAAKNFLSSPLQTIEELLSNPKIVAVGEIGLDKFVYQKTKYENYQISPEFVEEQKKLFIEQLKLAGQYKKAVILHNRLATKETLELLLPNIQDLISKINLVFHCCEPDDRLLDFAIKHNIFIGVDGDVTYNLKKQEFVKKIPLSLLVLETDAPFLLPEPLRSKKLYPNKPENIPIIAEFIAKLKGIDIGELMKTTDNNAAECFRLIVK